MAKMMHSSSFGTHPIDLGQKTMAAIISILVYLCIIILYCPVEGHGIIMYSAMLQCYVITYHMIIV